MFTTFGGQAACYRWLVLRKSSSFSSGLSANQTSYDMIETYKVLSGIYTSVAPEIHIISEHATRGNSLKIANRRCHYNLRKYSFSMRITNVWNSLPFSVVTAPSVNSFKNRLDKNWALQELKYDWETELSGTGSRSRVEF